MSSIAIFDRPLDSRANPRTLQPVVDLRVVDPNAKGRRMPAPSASTRAFCQEMMSSARWAPLPGCAGNFWFPVIEHRRRRISIRVGVNSPRVERDTPLFATSPAKAEVKRAADPLRRVVMEGAATTAFGFAALMMS